MSAADTIAALATPSGESAIALIRVSGPAARAIAVDILGVAPTPRLATRADLRARDGVLLDDAIITYFQEPNSYTGEDVIEISGHGNPVLAHRILEDLFSRGCRPAEPGEFTKRAFLNGRIDLSQAEAVMDLIRARGDLAIDAANRQLRGALGRKIDGLIDALLSATARVEAYIDFPEEDLPPEDRRALRGAIEEVLTPLLRLLATGRYGELLRAGVRTVLVGETNAGKSSLLNRLLGWERAIVSPSPGTTRDFLEEPRILGRHCIRFIDTAGLNPSPGQIEAMGIGRTIELAANADLILLVLDSTRPFPDLDDGILRGLHRGNTILVWNKADLAGPGVVPSPLDSFRSACVCAIDGSGISSLETAVLSLVESHRMDPGPDFVVVNSRHSHDLAVCRDALQAALGKLETGQADELLASDLRIALDALGRIGGKVDNERMLDKLFGQFCIGK